MSYKKISTFLEGYPDIELGPSREIHFKTDDTLLKIKFGKSKNKELDGDVIISYFHEDGTKRSMVILTVSKNEIRIA